MAEAAERNIRTRTQWEETRRNKRTISEGPPAITHKRSSTKGNKGGQTYSGHTCDTSQRVLGCRCRKTHTLTHTSPTHIAPHSHLPHTNTHILKHTLAAAYLVALWLRWHHFSSISCYKTTISVLCCSRLSRMGGGVFLLQPIILSSD